MADFPLSNKCFVPAKCSPTASRCSALTAGALPHQLIWTPPRSTMCGLSGPPSPCFGSDLATRQAAAEQQLWECALQEHILHHHELPRDVRPHQLDWWQPGDAIARPLSHEKIALPALLVPLSYPLQPLVLPPPAGATNRVGSPRCQASSAARQHKGGHDIHGRLQHGPWPAGYAGADRARGKDRRRLAGASLAGAYSPRHGRERTATLDNVLNQGSEGQAWVLRWGMASIHASEPTLAAMRVTFPNVVLCFIPPRSTSCWQPCDVAVFRSFKSHIQAQASATLARSVLDDSFEGLAKNKAWRRQFSEEWTARAVTDLCDENKVWASIARKSDAEFRKAVEEANELHAAGYLFSRQVEPEPAPADPVKCSMAEASDDEDDAPCQTRRLSQSSCGIRTSDVKLGVVHRTAPGIWRWTALTTPKKRHLHQISASLSVVSRVGSLVCCARACVSMSPRPDHQSQAPRR